VDFAVMNRLVRHSAVMIERFKTDGAMKRKGDVLCCKGHV